MERGLELRLAEPSLEQAVSDLFREILASDVSRYFHPHPFDTEAARRICAGAGADRYYVMLCGGVAIGYGMLRGWDEGFDIPSVGIYVSVRWRGHGLGRLLMAFLHASARIAGAQKVRLRVHEDNVAAMRLYRSLGYEFTDTDRGQLVGVKRL